MDASQKQHTIDDNPLVIADGLQKQWAESAKVYMDDEDFGATLDLVVKIIAKPNVPPTQVGALITQLSAYAVKFRMMFTGHMSYLKATTEANMKKNHYKELYSGIDKLVDALKYLVK